MDRTSPSPDRGRDLPGAGIHAITLYKWRNAWRLQGEVVSATQTYPECWGPADKFTVVLETSGSTLSNWVPPALNVACSPRRWAVGGRRPRMPMPSRC